MKERGYTNPFQVPRLEKIVINMGVGEGKENAKVLDFATADLQAIAGQKPVVTRAKKSIANFKLRENVAHRLQGHAARARGCTSSSTGSSTWPCRGCGTSRACPPRASTAAATTTLGLKEQVIFPEIVYDKVDKVRGMDIIMVTTARTDEEAKALLDASRRALRGSPRSWPRPRSS